MATRASVDYYVEQAEKAMDYALKQLEERKKQEFYNQTEYSDAQLGLEQAYNDLQDIMHSANSEQKERLYRCQLRLQRIQNDLILDQQDLMM